MWSVKVVTMWILIIAIPIADSCLQSAIADIYTYTDERGVTHFSNVPTSPQYRLKIREFHFDYKRLSSGAYDNIIKDICLKYSVDPLLVKAIIKTESDFDPAAASVKGAKGLMQLMPETADDMGINNVYDPENNIYGGVKYLKRLMGVFKSDVRLVVAAYNAGENTVLKYNNIPPFKETQRYVKRVFKHLKEYKTNKGNYN
ncbi:MAG: lytic transglycosylase domain-containing protein [Deltaproteobacteria bacterium]|nr:lytic transglycosylase domain-containing protein [Deltaproteobacteria bacterium]